MTIAPGSIPHRRRGFGWLALLAVAALAAGAVFWCADDLRALLGHPGHRGDDGVEPTRPFPASATLRRLEPPSQAPAGDPVALGVAGAASPMPAPTPAGPISGTGHRDQAAGTVVLHAADAAYRSYRLETAASNADRVATMDVDAPLAARARAIALGARALGQLLARFAGPDEMARSLDTSPGHVRIATATAIIDAVPLRDGTTGLPVPVESDPEAWIRSQQRLGPVAAMIKGKSQYMRGQLSGDLGDITVVNQSELRVENETAFEQRLTALRNGAQSGDALAWYRAACFAYQNRLDGHVTDMLDQALALDPDLVRDVREAKAQELCAAMLMQIHLGNKESGARTWLSLIIARYGDTPTGRIAPALFQGDARQVAALAVAQGPQPAQRAVPAAAPRAPAQRPLGAGDLDMAHQAMERGYALVHAAMNMPATAARNDQYRAALDQFSAAIAQLRALLGVHPDDDALGKQLVEANELAAACRKYITPF